MALRHNRRLWLSGLLGMSLMASAMWVSPTSAAAVSPDRTAREKSTPVSALRSRAAASPALPADVPGPAAVWPTAGAAVLDLTPGSATVPQPVEATVGGLPIEVAPPVSDILSLYRSTTASQAPSAVRVELLDPAQTSQAGFPLVAKVSRADGLTTDTSLNLEVGYGAFRNAFGAGWQSRLRLVLLPCGTVTSEEDQCLPVPLKTRNDVAAGLISAQVPVTATVTPGTSLSAKQAAAQGLEPGESTESSEPGAVVALASSPQSSVGDFTRTDLKASSQWAAGSNSGDFSYTYPFSVPPVPSGLTPPLELTYSSGAVDGVTGSENTQTSWIGEGWQMHPGSIERTLRPCFQDQDHSPYWTVKSGDRCWRHDNFQISFGGRSGELVPTGSGNVWRLANDDGSRLQLLTDGSYAGGERWLLTDKAGTQYWFGMTRLPGWRSSGANSRETNAILTAPGFANHTGEPCFMTQAFRNSRCNDQAYRWQLDYVVDTSGNSMSYWYTRETNRSALAGNTGLGADYDRASYLTRIEYGTRAGGEAAPNLAPAVVEFGVADRCFSSCGTKDRAHWPDTPHDLTCDADPCYAKNPSPSFWTRKRLTSVLTKVRDGGSYRPVDEWSLSHQFPATGSSMQHPALWLYAITHTGHTTGTALPTPPVTFGGTKLNNRADWDTGMEPHYKYRIVQVNTETGGRLTVAYYSDDSGCAFGTTPPPTDMNNRRCFPQLFTNQADETGWSWWHKRIVYRVVEEDLVGGSPDVTSEYVYSMSEAVPGSGQSTVLWGFTKGVWGTVDKTWSQWAGYAAVHTRVGDPAAPLGPARTHTKTVYFQGLDRDETNAGSFTRSNKIVDSTGVSKVDHQALAGQVRETLTFNGDGGSAIGRTLTDQTLTQTAGGTLSSWQTPAERKAFMVTKTDQQTSTWLNHNSTWRTANSVTTVDVPYGNTSTVEDKGDLAVTGDETCTRYTYNTANTGQDLLRRNGVGTLATAGIEPRGVRIGMFGSADDMLIVEFTGDGKKDLITRTPGDGKLWLYPGDGSGGFGTGTAIGTGFTADWDQVFSPGDFNGDGKNDVLARRLSDSKLFMFQGNSAGGWLNDGNGTVVSAFGSNYHPIFSAGDLTGDGKPDVVARILSTDQLAVYPGNGTGGLANGGSGTQIGVGFNAADYDKIFSTGDADGDGKNDILARRTYTSQLIAYLGSGASSLPGEQIYAQAIHPHNILFGNGDTTGDSKPDLYTRDTYTKGITGVLARTETVAKTCATTPSYPQDLLSDSRTFYDNTTYTTAVLAYGLPTKTEAVKFHDGSNPTYITTGTAVYDQYGRTTSAKDTLNRETVSAYTHTPDGLLSKIEITNPLGHKVSTTLDITRGQLATIVDANGKTSTGSYDSLGRLLKVWKPGHSTSGTPDVEYAYSVNNVAPSWTSTKVLGPNGNQILTYGILDGFLNIRQTQDTAPDGKRTITDIRYNKRGLTDRTSTFYNNASGPTATLATFSDADVDRQAQITYDGTGRVVADELLSHNAMVSKSTYIHDGDRTGTIPPAGGTATQEVFDARGQVIERRHYSGSPFTGTFDKTRYAYDLLGQLTSTTDNAGNVWSQTYDLLGRQATAVDPDAGNSSYTYDDAGQMTLSRDARGIDLAYGYDDLGRKTGIFEGSITGTRRAGWVYDTVAKGQLTSSTRYDQGLAYTASVGSYDDGYRPLTASTVIPTLAANGALAGTYSTSRTYKPDGSLATQALPAAGGLPAETLTHTYSDTGYAQTMTGTWSGGSQTYIASTTNTYDGLRSQSTLGNAGKRVRQTSGFDPVTRNLTSLQTDTETATPGTFTDKFTSEYGYDLAGNVTAIAGKTGGARDQVECFTYDYLQRLSKAWTASTWNCSSGPQRAGADPYWREWTVDAIGNRLQQVDKNADGTNGTTWNHQVGVNHGVKPHQLKSVAATGPLSGTATRSYGYDAAGNTTSRTTDAGTAQTLTWDKENRLATVTEGTTTSSYLYTADGTRLIARDATGATLYLGGTQLRLTTSNSTVSATRFYGVATRNAVALNWTISDHHGTEQISIDAATLTTARRRTMPYGETRGTQPAWPNQHGYLGGDKDTTGLTHLGAREYDPTIGQFISPDPIHNLSATGSQTAYSYAGHSPISMSDASGLAVERDRLTGGNTPAHDTAIQLRVTALTVMYPGAIISADVPGGLKGADLVCYNCSLLSGGPDVIWVWEFKPDNADGRSQGRTDVDKHIDALIAKYGKKVERGPMFPYPQTGQNGMDTYQQVTVRSDQPGVEVYKTRRDDEDNPAAQGARERREAISILAKRKTSDENLKADKFLARLSDDIREQRSMRYEKAYNSAHAYCWCNETATTVPFAEEPTMIIIWIIFGRGLKPGGTPPVVTPGRQPQPARQPRKCEYALCA